MKISGPIWALGAMSGTSLDGVDAAMIRTDGIKLLELGPTAYRPYNAGERLILREALGQWPDGPNVPEAAKLTEDAHALLMDGSEGCEIIGFHGQTLAHEPENNRTHQAGNGARLAQILGIPVVWDFRSADVEMGGQGAPLAPFYHFACAKYLDLERPVAFLNLGGVGNITYVDPSFETPEEPGALLAFDTGPANAPLNDLMQRRRGVPYDENGALAAQGQVAEDVVRRFLEHPFFFRVPPKSLDRDAFQVLDDAVAELSDADAAATLVACLVTSVAKAVQLLPQPPAQLFVTGGGRRNKLIMDALDAAILGMAVPVDEVGLDGDMLEAQAFAYLAVRVARGLPTSCPGTTGVKAMVGGGTVSLPN